MIKAADVFSLLRSVLRADPTVNEKTRGRVLGDHIASADLGTIVEGGPVLILELDGGALTYPSATFTGDVWVYSYSPTNSGEATDLYDDACTALHGMRLAVAEQPLRGWAREVERPIRGRSEDARAFWTRGRFRVRVG